MVMYALGLEAHPRGSLAACHTILGIGSVVVEIFQKLSPNSWRLFQVGVVMRTAGESADGPGRPFLVSFGAEKGSTCPNRNTSEFHARVRKRSSHDYLIPAILPQKVLKWLVNIIPAIRKVKVKWSNSLSDCYPIAVGCRKRNLKTQQDKGDNDIFLRYIRNQRHKLLLCAVGAIGGLSLSSSAKTQSWLPSAKEKFHPCNGQAFCWLRLAQTQIQSPSGLVVRPRNVPGGRI
ncbi:uncharacterized protein CIMG_13728 [Coccidioides immitis RS]|uniref:Uncharacterized protein n=1 Tax=Coccidioides immitis (strain RS) TaxID=246410 RepID=A0A0D8JX73_COCIM|nr:uncharacterized protein CIMG_13728 [Coccidioides immitis RS]KJF61536.1 hypothetical protein CIMG_13728 [Coccidioides immitis RS]